MNSFSMDLTIAIDPLLHIISKRNVFTTKRWIDLHHPCPLLTRLRNHNPSLNTKCFRSLHHSLGHGEIRPFLFLAV